MSLAPTVLLAASDLPENTVEKMPITLSVSSCLASFSAIAAIVFAVLWLFGAVRAYVRRRREGRK